MMVCHDRLKNMKFEPEEVKSFDVAGAICNHLENLIAQEQLDSWEKKLKTEYKKIFELILHADDLPHDIVAEIHIKNAEKTIKSRSYPSPWKYKDVRWTWSNSIWTLVASVCLPHHWDMLHRDEHESAQNAKQGSSAWGKTLKHLTHTHTITISVKSSGPLILKNITCVLKSLNSIVLNVFNHES